jgi:rhodanese-related sulfurtransferase/DNA-binding MarR family transcriptional regulator
MGPREFKDRIYAQFARIGAALASDKRLELIDLLAQAPRNVEALAAETGMSIANASQHLQALKAAHLVDTARNGTRVVYRLASDDVLRLWLDVHRVAEAQLAEVGRLARDFAVEGVPAEQVSRKSVMSTLRDGEIVLLDVRPAIEYASGHIPGALALPIEDLETRLSELPRDKKVVVYCRGTYCQFADEAVALLRQHGVDAFRLEGGWQEWRGESRDAGASRRARTRT